MRPGMSSGPRWRDASRTCRMTGTYFSLIFLFLLYTLVLPVDGHRQDRLGREKCSQLHVCMYASDISVQGHVKDLPDDRYVNSCFCSLLIGTDKTDWNRETSRLHQHVKTNPLSCL